VNCGTQLSAEGDYSAYLIWRNLLKTNATRVALHLQCSRLLLEEMFVIVYALAGAILLLVAVNAISSINTSGRRRP
jgi:hypothetical protein